jgi:hypothetical protein
MNIVTVWLQPTIQNALGELERLAGRERSVGETEALRRPSDRSRTSARDFLTGGVTR